VEGHSPVPEGDGMRMGRKQIQESWANIYLEPEYETISHETKINQPSNAAIDPPSGDILHGGS